MSRHISDKNLSSAIDSLRSWRPRDRFWSAAAARIADAFEESRVAEVQINVANKEALVYLRAVHSVRPRLMRGGLVLDMLPGNPEAPAKFLLRTVAAKRRATLRKRIKKLEKILTKLRAGLPSAG